jgi:serine/threonine-protein kinase
LTTGTGPAPHEKPTLKLRECLGKGGFGEVYMADMRSSGGLSRRVAVKLLHKGLDPRSQAVERLRDEARLLSTLHHTSILGVYDLVVLDGRVGLIAEYVEGADLGDCMGSSSFGPRTLVEVIERTAAALDAAWSAPGPDGPPLRIVHRDIKPANIRVTVQGEVKVLDFGIAKAALSGREAKTETDQVVGTVHYMAPERFQPGEAADSPASDVYSLGCVMYEGLTGRTLFGDLDLPKILGLTFNLYRHRDWTQDRLSSLPPEVKHLQPMLERLLSPNPDERPTADEVADWCEAVKSGLPGPTLRQWAKAKPWSSLNNDGVAQNSESAEAPANLAGDAGGATFDTLLPSIPKDRVPNAAPQPANLDGMEDGSLARPASPTGRALAAVLLLGAATLGVLGLVLAGIGAGTWWLVTTWNAPSPSGTESGPAQAVETTDDPTESIEVPTPTALPGPSVPEAAKVPPPMPPRAPTTADRPSPLAPVAGSSPATSTVETVPASLPTMPPTGPDPAHVAAIQETVQAGQGQLARCYEAELRKNPRLEGRVEVAWTVQYGTVKESRIVTNTTGSQSLGDCISSKVQKWQFPTWVSGPVEWPFTFRRPSTSAPANSPTPEQMGATQTLTDSQAIVDMVKSTLSAQTPLLRSCYDTALRKTPELSGKWTLGFVVEKDGSVSGANAVGQNMANADFESCLARSMSAWRYQPIVNPLPVKKTVEFTR